MPKGGDYGYSGKGVKSGSMPSGDKELKFNSTGTQGTGGTSKPEHTTKSGPMYYGSKRMC